MHFLRSAHNEFVMQMQLHPGMKNFVFAMSRAFLWLKLFPCISLCIS